MFQGQDFWLCGAATVTRRDCASKRKLRSDGSTTLSSSYKLMRSELSCGSRLSVHRGHDLTTGSNQRSVTLDMATVEAARSG